MRFIDFDRRILLFLLLYCFGTHLSAQIAKEHYIPPLYYPLGELEAGYTGANKCNRPYINRQELSLATDSQTAISVTITDGAGNALSGIASVTISRGNPVTLELGNEDQSTPIMVQTSLVNEVIANKGLVLKSTKPFYASLRIATDSNKCNGNTASSSLKQADFIISKGIKALGRAFRLVNTNLTPSGITNPNDSRVKWDQLKNHYVGIMATEDNTNVRLSEYPQNLKLGVYDPVAKKLIGVKNIQNRDTLSLDKGESFVFVAPTDATNPMGFTGTLVTSDNPIAVNVGNIYGGDFDLMVDQIVPIKRLGTEYAIIKGEGQRQKYEQGIVVATDDNTTVSVDGSVVKTLAKAGDFYQVYYLNNISTRESRYIKTSKPAYVYQVLAAARGSVGFIRFTPNTNNNYINITTTLSIIPPLSDYNYSYLNMVSKVNQIGLKTFRDSYILALIKKTASIVVNNGLVRASSSNLTGNNDWAIHKIYNTTKNIVVESAQPMVVGIYSGGDNLGYSGYFTGFSVLEAEICSSDSATDIFDYMQVPDPTFTGTTGTWNPAFASGTNIFDPSVDVEGEYEYQYQANFTFLQKTQKVKITIIPALDVTGMNISRLANKVCIGDGTSYELDAPNLLDGDYRLRYTIEKTGMPTIAKTEEITINNHKASIDILAKDISTLGTYTLKLTKIENDVCEEILALQQDLEITPDVDITGIVLSGIDCQIDTTDYTVGIEMINATAGEEYTLKYKVTGANTKLETSLDIILDTNKKATWTIPYTAINKIGMNKIELVSIQYKNTVCAMKSVTNIDKSFDTFYSNNTRVTVSSSDVCQGEGLRLTITDSNLVDGTYEIGYEITGSNAVTSSQEILFTAGIRFWGIPASEIPNVGANTLKIKYIKEKNSPCVLPLSLSNNFVVFPDVNQNGITLTGIDCQIDMTDYAVGIEMTNATARDEYTLNYKVTGANTKSKTSVDIILDTNKKATWTIPYADISKMGTNTIELVSIQYKNSVICPFRTLSNVKKSFETFYSNNIKVKVTNDTCQGDSLILSISSDGNLLDSLYEIGYEITGSNTVTSSLEIPIRSGGLFWGIPASEIPNVGMNTVKITYLKEKTSSCVLPLSIIDNFEIFPDVNKNGITLKGIDCQTTTTDYTVGIEMMNAIAGDEYTLNYKITGANPQPETSLDITLDVNKKAIWTIPHADISKIGTNTIELVSIQYKSSIATCSFSILSNVNKSFETIYTNTLTTTVPLKICQGSDLSVEITDANLPDATYEIKYKISQSNAITSIREIAMSSGKGTLIIPASELVNYGNNTFEIQSIKRKGSVCVLPLSTSDNFEITPNVNITNIVLTGDACKIISTDYQVTIEMPNGNPLDEYMLKYKVTGTNTKRETSLDITLDANKKATWTIPYAEINKIGINTIALTAIQFKTTLCTVKSVTNIDKSFETIYTNTLTTAVPLKICQGLDLSVEITDANLPDATYEIKYKVSQSNAITNTREIVMSSGKGTLVIPASELPNYGNNTFEIESISRKRSTCILPLSTSDNFEITPNVNITNIALTGDACKIISTDYQVTIEMPNGNPLDEYMLKYKVTGTNTKRETSLDITLDANKKATWTIPYAEINKIGINTIALTAIQFKTTLCTVKSITNIDKSFETIYTNTLTPTVPSKICQGTALSVAITDANLPDATYEIKYKISQSNAITNTREIAMSSGKGTLIIPASELLNYGNNTFEIESINRKGSTCILPLSTSDNFDIAPVLLTSELSITANTCIVIDPTVGTTVDIVNSNPTTTTDVYTVTYEIRGSNVLLAKTQDVTMINTNGQLTIAASEISKAGDSTILIKEIKHKGKTCATTLNLKYPIRTIYEASLRTMSNSIVGNACTLTDQTIEIALDNAIVGKSYQFLYTLSGANKSNDIEVSVIPDNQGKASFNISNTFFLNEGITKVSLKTIADCEDRIINTKGITTDIFMNLTPVISATDILVDRYFCFGSDIDVSINNVNTFKNGKTYTVTYKLSGANNSLEKTHTQQLTNQKISFIIPGSEIFLGGVTNVNITKIESSDGCVYNQLTSKSFTVVQIDTSEISFRKQNNCDGSSLIKINNSRIPITDGEYQLNYMINGIVKTVNLQGERGFFIMNILREDFKEGQNTIQLNSLKHNLSGCFVAFKNDEIHQIDKQGLLDFDTIRIITPTLFCKNEKGLEVEISTLTLSSSTTNFIIEYDLLGVNQHKDIAQEVVIDANKVTFEVPVKYFTNRGNGMITIKNIRVKNESCEGNNIDISKDFYTSMVTDIFREEVKEKYSFCKDDNPTLSDIYLNNPISPNIFWYDSVDAIQPIDQSTIIKESIILYARRVNADKCLGNYVTTEIDFTLCDKIVFPTKVSANGDNINDEFYIQDLEKLYPNYTLNIYDRNGVMVYQDNSSTPSFKGISNQSEQMLNQNNKLPKGIYYYILNYNSLVNKRKKPIQGYFYFDY